MINNYYNPSSLQEALEILSKDQNTIVLAGGTDLLLKPGFKNGLQKTDILSLKSIPGLDEIQVKENPSVLLIGSRVTMNSLAESELVIQAFPSLACSARSVGSYSLRNTATLGGNICNASPAGDTLTPFLALEAVFILAGKEGEKRIPANLFFTGPGSTVLQPGEILTGVEIPSAKNSVRAERFCKIGKRKAVEISLVNAAILLETEGGKVLNTAIAFGAVAPTPVRIPEAEQFLTGLSLDSPEISGAIDKTAKTVMEGIKPITDFRASKEYRKALAGEITRRLLWECTKELQERGR